MIPESLKPATFLLAVDFEWDAWVDEGALNFHENNCRESLSRQLRGRVLSLRAVLEPMRVSLSGVFAQLLPISSSRK